MGPGFEPEVEDYSLIMYLHKELYRLVVSWEYRKLFDHEVSELMMCGSMRQSLGFC